MFYSIFGTVQILTVMQGVHSITWVCSVWTDGLGGQCASRSGAAGKGV